MSSRPPCPALALVCAGLATLVLAPVARAGIPVSLPWSEDFEGTSGEVYTSGVSLLTGAPFFSYEMTATGRLRMAAGTGFAHSGSGAATLDSVSTNSASTNYLALSLQMGNYTAAVDAVILNFHFMNHGDENDAEDRVWVRGSLSDTWVEIADWYAISGGTDGQWFAVEGLDISAALLGAGQDYSSSFGIRFGQRDNYSATSPTLSDGVTFDDIEVEYVYPDDMAVAAILSPEDDSCGLSDNWLEVEVENVGAAAQSNVAVSVQVTGDVVASFTGIAAGPLAAGDVEVVTVGPIDLFMGGSIQITATVGLPGDLDPSNDSLTASATLQPTFLPVLPPDPVCPGSAATLEIDTPDSGVVYGWYDTPGGTQLGTGDSFTTSPLSGPTSFWVLRESAPDVIGAPDNAIAGGSYYSFFNEGLVFDVYDQLMIDSVFVYPDSAGDVVVNVEDRFGNFVATVVHAVTAADIGLKTEVPMGLVIPAGTGYEMNAAGSTVSGLFRNMGGASYPYVGVSAELTGPINSLVNYYYFFYDWQVGGAACGDEPTEVVVSVDAAACTYDLALSLTAQSSAIAGEETLYVATVTNFGPDTAPSTILGAASSGGTSFVSNTGDCGTDFPCSIGDISPGQIAVVTSTVAVDSDYDTSAPLSETMTASSGGTDTDLTNNSAVAVTVITAEADMWVSLEADPDPALAAAPLTWTVEVFNLGPSDATDVAAIFSAPQGYTVSSTSGCAEDPAGAPTCTLGTVVADTAVVVTLEGLVDAAQTDELEGHVVVTSSVAEASPGDESAGLVVSVETQADLVLSLSDDPDPVVAGDALTYTVSVTNTGPSDAVDLVVVLSLSDDVEPVATTGCEEDPQGWEVCSVASLAPAESVELTFEVAVPADFEGSLLAEASVSAGTPEALAGDESAAEETEVGLPPPAGDDDDGDDDDDDNGFRGADRIGCSCNAGAAPPGQAGLGLLLVIAGAIRRRRCP